jgi:methionine biosynthesis protein MetW
MKNLYHKKILEIITPNSRVLDLGCGNGELLEILIKKKNIKGYGIEIDYNNVLACVKRGISVFQGNIDEGLPEFTDGSYDFIILSQTLQEVQKPLFVLHEMLRVGQKVIVTFPNFAYWACRLQLLQGKAPITCGLPYEWFNTPNIRLININDFRSLCKKNKFKILKEIPLYKSKFLQKFSPKFCANLLAEKGMFLLEKKK